MRYNTLVVKNDGTSNQKELLAVLVELDKKIFEPPVYPYDYNQWINELAAPGIEIFLMCDHDRPVGFLSAQVIFTSKDHDSIDLKRTCEIELRKIGILKEYRRKNCASYLFDQAKKKISKEHGHITDVFLEVYTGNEAAVKFYQNAGFQIQSERKDYYGKSFHCYAMHQKCR